MVMAVTARGLLTLRLMPTMAMEAMVDTVSATARGLLTPRRCLLWLRRLWWIWSWLHHWLRLGYGKRSADSEADAYYGYGGYGLGYTTGYGLGYGYGGYGKRS